MPGRTVDPFPPSLHRERERSADQRILARLARRARLSKALASRRSTAVFYNRPRAVLPSRTGASHTLIRAVFSFRPSVRPVSSVGRIFSELLRIAGKNTRQDDQVSNQGVLKWQFQGRSLIADQQFARSARRLIVDFDENYATCAMKVVHGKEVESQTFLYRSMASGRMLQMLNINVMSTTCSIREGNVFGISG